MARPLRLRQKLTLGLALTVGSVGLLVGGITLAYLSHVTADKATAEKLVQIQLVMQVHHWAHLMTITPSDRTDRAAQIDHILECTKMPAKLPNTSARFSIVQKSTRSPGETDWFTRTRSTRHWIWLMPGWVRQAWRRWEWQPAGE